MAAYTQTQLISAFTNANAGLAPTAAQQQTLLAYSNQNAAGSLTDAQTLQATINLAADATTSVGVETYQFFTGTAPSAAGLAFLNGAYAATGAQVGLNAENRFIAQSVALATQNATAKTAFTAAYGSLSVAAATAQAYDVIVGNAAAAAAGINVANAVAFLSSAATVDYYTKFIKANTALTAQADIDLAVKAAIVGEIMYSATTYNNGAGVGSYATATNNLLTDLADDGKLVFDNAAGINLFTAYPGSGGGSVGATLTLTANIDAPVATAGNDTIIGDANTVAAADQIDGGNGFDTFKYYANTADLLPALKNVEAIYLYNSGADITVSGVTGLQQAWLSGTTAGARTVTLDSGVTAGIENQTVNTDAYTFAFGGTGTSASATISGSTDAGTLNLDNAAITTLNLTSSGTSANKIAALASTGTETTVNVLGNANLEITAALAASVKTISAGTFGGGLTATFGAAASAAVTTGTGADTIDVHSVTGKVTAALGDGNDTLKLGAMTVDTTSTLDGGAGTDTVQITDGAKLTTAVGKLITNFETLSTGAGTGTYDSSLITGITSITVDGDLAGATNVTNLTASSAAVSITAAQTGTEVLTLALKDATGTSDSLALTLGGGAVAVGGVYALTDAIETITVNSIANKASGANVITSLDIDDAKVLNINATNALTVTDIFNGDTLTKIDASASTKGFVMTHALTTATQSVTYIGGAGDDTFKGAGTAGPAGDTFKGGAGADTITLATAGQSDTVIYTAATDSVLKVASDGVTTSGFDKIGAFTVAEDKIDLSTLGFTGFAAGGVKSLGALTSITATSITDLFDVTGSDRGVAFGTFGGNTYVFVDVNHDGNFTAAADLFIELTGVTSALSATDFSFGA